MDNIYLELLNNMKDANMDYLSNVALAKRDQTGFQSLIGDGEYQLNQEDVVNFFAPVADAILTQLTDHDYFSFKISKNKSGVGCLLKTSDTVFKFAIPNLPGQGPKIIMNAVRSKNLSQMSFANNECYNNVSNTFAMLLIYLDMEDDYDL